MIEYITIISITNEEFLKKGKLFWGQKYIDYIKNFISADFLNNGFVKRGLIYFINSKNISGGVKNLENVLSINVNNIEIQEKYIAIEFNIGGKTEHRSDILRSILRNYFSKKFNLAQTEQIPFVSFIPYNDFEYLFTYESITAGLNLFTQQNDWAGIVNLFQPIDNIEKSEFWNESKILSKLAFALSKLSEIDKNVVKKLSDKNSLDNYLDEKKRFREFCLKIYKRCIELDKSPSHYSSLAYFHYKNALEFISIPKIKSENFLEEIHNSLINLEDALQLDHTRINDHYRKAYILTFLLPEEIKNSKVKSDLTIKYSNVKELKKEGLSSFERVIKIFESNIISETEKKRYFKLYIKTLYSISSYFESLVITKMEKYYLLLKLIYPEKALQYVNNERNYKVRNILKSREYLEKLIRWVDKKYISQEEEKEIINVIDYEDSISKEPIISTQLKVYKMGKLHFQLYLLTNDKEHLKLAKRYTMKALNVKYKPKGIQVYIYYLLANILMLEGKFKETSKLIYDLSKKVILSDYMVIVEILNLICLGEYEQATRKIKFMESKSKKLYINELRFLKFIIAHKIKKLDLEMLMKLKYNFLGNFEIRNFTNMDALVEKLRVIKKESNTVIRMDIYERLIIEILARD